MNPFDWRIVVAILAGGGIGSVLRYAMTFGITQRFGPGFPWATFAINLLGSLVIGMVFQLAQTRALGVTPLVRIFLMTGVLGGFTTFSTFSLDLVTLSAEGAPLLAFLYGTGSVIFGFAGAYIGIVAMRALQP